MRSCDDELFRADQAARVSLDHVMNDVRKCSGVLVDDAMIEATVSGQARLYEYDAVNKYVKLTLPDAPGAPTYKLVGNVAAMKFGTDGKTVSMTITIELGDNSVTLNGSAMPRLVAAFN